MFSFRRCFAVLFAIGFLTSIASAQDPFSWSQSTIGGGGYCMEIRFAPRDDFFGKTAQQKLYLATDISGIYRSEAIDAVGEVTQWKRLIDANPASEDDALPAYTTTLAFTDRFLGQQNQERLIVGTQEGIFIWNESNQSWRRAQQPTRSTLDPNNLHKTDGKYSWISIIRQCPPNAQYLAAGIGDIRIDNAQTDYSKHGLSTILRSSDGGNSWTAFKIPQGIAVADTEEVFDIDYSIMPNSLNQTLDYIFVATDFGIYVIWDSVNTQTGQVFKTSFRRISNLSGIADWRAVIVLGDAAGTVQTTDNLLIFASRIIKQGVGKSAYRLNTTMASLLNPNYTPVWQEEDPGSDTNMGQMAAKPGSRISSFQVFLGKNNQPSALCVRADATLDPAQAWYKIYKAPNTNNIDNGYREDKTEMAFGSLDINPSDTQANPTVYGCARYGPMLAKGNNGSQAFNATRQIEQMFTTLVTTPGDGDSYFASRGALDEVDFKGCPPVFHPNASDTIMIGCYDNGILRSFNGGQSWSQRRLRDSDLWKGDASNPGYGTKRQGVFHIAYHPSNRNLVIASAGPVEPEGQGELAFNLKGGRGKEDDWSTLAGGPQAGTGTWNGLPNAQIRAFVFDEGSPVKVDRNGIFATVHNSGLYYGKVDGNGNVTQAFQRITDATLTAVIPLPGVTRQHHYTRLLFDPHDSSRNTLYLAREGPGGGVFRIQLDSIRANLSISNCIARVDEVIKGRYVGVNPGAYSSNHAIEVNELLVTPTHVFAGVSPYVDVLRNEHYAGGLVLWAKNDSLNPSSNTWRIGGPTSLPNNSTKTTVSIGGIARDPEDGSIYAVTYRYVMKDTNGLDPNNTRRHGEENYKLMKLWRSSNEGQSFAEVQNTGLLFPNAVSMAFFYAPQSKLKLLVPTKGNGVWIGERIYIPLQKQLNSPDSAATDENLPKRFALHANFPNPFNPATMIKYDLPRNTEVRLVIIDVLGRVVRTLVDEKQKAGYHAKHWDGKNERGAPMASGVYFYRMQTPEFSKVRKMTFLR